MSCSTHYSASSSPREPLLKPTPRLSSTRCGEHPLSARLNSVLWITKPWTFRKASMENEGGQRICATSGNFRVLVPRTVSEAGRKRVCTRQGHLPEAGSPPRCVACTHGVYIVCAAALEGKRKCVNEMIQHTGTLSDSPPGHAKLTHIFQPRWCSTDPASSARPGTAWQKGLSP